MKEIKKVEQIQEEDLEEINIKEDLEEVPVEEVLEEEKKENLKVEVIINVKEQEPEPEPEPESNDIEFGMTEQEFLNGIEDKKKEE